MSGVTAADFNVVHVEELRSQIRQLEFQRNHMLDRNVVKDAIVSLTLDLLEETEVEFLSEDQIDVLNNILESLGLSTVKKIYKLTVQATFTQEVEIEVKADSLDLAIREVEYGSHDEIIRCAVDTYSLEVTERNDIQEA